MVKPHSKTFLMKKERFDIKRCLYKTYRKITGGNPYACPQDLKTTDEGS